jgi:hypothetical protein
MYFADIIKLLRENQRINFSSWDIYILMKQKNSDTNIKTVKKVLRKITIYEPHIVRQEISVIYADTRGKEFVYSYIK